MRVLQTSPIWPSEAVLHYLHIAEKVIPDCGHGGDVAGLMRIIPEQPPKQRNAACERIVGNGAIVPNRTQKLILRDQSMGTAKQEEQDPKGLRLDRQQLAGLNDAELAFSNLHISEGENKALMLRHEFITPFQGMIRSPS